MDPAAKSLELLSQSIPFVAVRIYDGHPELGTRLLVTHREVFGSVADSKLQSALVARAREVLERGRPVSTELLYDSGALKVFLEPCLPDETLVIVGAGHIARPLCQLAKLLGFRVIIVDDREEYANREGDIVSGIVQRFEPKQIILDLGKSEAVLPISEQVRTERYRVGQRLKVCVMEVHRTNKGPQVVVSRSHRNLIKRLSELEVLH